MLPQGRPSVRARCLLQQREPAVGNRDEQGVADSFGPDSHAALPHTVDGKITNGEIDPSFVITHVEPLDNAPEAYKKFRDKEDGCIKVVLKP